MKKFYIIFILNLFLFQGFCQSTFELLIDNNHDEYPFEVIQTGHGDYFLVAASREDYTSSFYTQILHISQDGEILDTTELHNSDGDCIMYNLLQTGENSMVAVGERKHAGAASDLWYIGFDTSLLVQWEKTYEVDGDWIKFIRSFISQNGLIISGITHAWTSSPSYSRLLFQKISLTGDSIYGKYDDWGTNRICFDLLEMDTIYLVFTSGYSSYPGGEIVTLLQNFTIVSIDSIPHRFGNTLTAKNRDTSSYFLTGTFRLNSHNCIGIEHLTRTHQEISFSYTSDPDVDDYGGADQSMDIFSPDTLYTAGTMNIDAYNPYYSTNQSWYCLNNFDSSLNLRWTRHFGGDAYYVLRYILATYDGGALLSGTKYDAGQPDKKLDIYIAVSYTHLTLPTIYSV